MASNNLSVCLSCVKSRLDLYKYVAVSRIDHLILTSQSEFDPIWTLYLSIVKWTCCQLCHRGSVSPLLNCYIKWSFVNIDIRGRKILGKTVLFIYFGLPFFCFVVLKVNFPVLSFLLGPLDSVYGPSLNFFPFKI